MMSQDGLAGDRAELGIGQHLRMPAGVVVAPADEVGTRWVWRWERVLRWVLIGLIVIPPIYDLPSHPATNWMVVGYLVLIAIAIGWVVSLAVCSALTRRYPQESRKKYWSQVKWALVLVVVAAGLTDMRGPSYLGFYVSRPGFDALATEVAGGKPLTSPRWCGVYRVTEASIMPDGSVKMLWTHRGFRQSGVIRLPANRGRGVPSLAMEGGLLRVEAIGDRWVTIN